MVYMEGWNMMRWRVEGEIDGEGGWIERNG